MEFTVYDGVRWHRRKSGYYAYSRRGLLHRYKWQGEIGPILAGYVVHHRDGDRGNNDLENLEVVTRKRHAAYHPATPERIARLREAVCGRREARDVPRVCTVCGSTFLACRQTALYCSTRCR